MFQIDADHTLYVGRSAANNDELTMRFARQNDWWMHVRGASGSHTVLRGVNGPKIPKQVLEVAAAITAYYSQARNASYVPVVYTQRKFVRKPKGANVGAVTLEREQTVMVRPGLPAGIVSDE
jgi:predicted ribosome quality control (RQC) complex YloA/Tae2 family protein